MNKLTVSILVPSIMAAGAVAAAAQSGPYYDSNALDYPLNAQFNTRPN